MKRVFVYLLLLLLLLAGGAAAYFFDDWRKVVKEVAEKAAPVGADKNKPAAKSGEGAKKGADKSAAGQTEKPVFDVVRVDPEGTAIFAGRAAAGSDVSVTSGGKVIGKSKADQNGDWIIMVEKPIEKGDHEFVLSSRAPGGGDELKGDKSVKIAVGPGKAQAGGAQDKKAGEAEDAKIAAAKQAEEQAKLAKAKEEQVKAEEQARLAKAAEEEAKRKEEALAAKKAAEEQAKAQEQARLAAERAKAEEEARLAKAAAEEAKAREEEAAKKAAEAEAEAKRKELASKPVSVDWANFLSGAGSEGRVIATGKAAPGETIRLKVDGRAVGSAKASKDGTGAVSSMTDLAPGNYALEVEQVDSSGKVVSSAERSFTRPAPTQPKMAEAGKEPAAGESAGGGEQKMAKAQAGMDGSGSQTSAQESGGEPAKQMAALAGSKASRSVRRRHRHRDVIQMYKGRRYIVIQRGDTLWGIAQRQYGGGHRYRKIYRMNRGKIRNPHWIYPNQRFRLPK